MEWVVKTFMGSAAVVERDFTDWLNGHDGREAPLVSREAWYRAHAYAFLITGDGTPMMSYTVHVTPRVPDPLVTLVAVARVHRG